MGRVMTELLASMAVARNTTRLQRWHTTPQGHAVRAHVEIREHRHAMPDGRPVQTLVQAPVQHFSRMELNK